MTGQPIPGDPSISTDFSPRSLATSRAWARTALTSFPEFSAAMPSFACTIGPKRVSETIHSPQTCSSKSIASAGQKRTHTPQPSHAVGETTYSTLSLLCSIRCMASKRHSLAHSPHAVHSPCRILAW